MGGDQGLGGTRRTGGNSVCEVSTYGALVDPGGLMWNFVVTIDGGKVMDQWLRFASFDRGISRRSQA